MWIWRVGCFYMKRWRIGWVSCALIILLFGVIFRLYQIQIMHVQSFSEKDMNLIDLASDSQSKEIVIHSGRGKIIDRHDEVITGEDAWRLLVFPQTKHQLSWRHKQFREMAQILDFPYEQLSSKLQNIKHPTLLSYPHRQDLKLTKKQKSKIEAMKIPGVFTVFSDGRMLDEQIGQQLIGRLVRQPFVVRELYRRELEKGIYTLQSRVGITGLEAAFETRLHGAAEKVLSYYHTRTGKPLHGAEVKVIEQEEPQKPQPHTVVTTLDKEIQRKAEVILQQQKVQDGAIVVQDITTGDMLALASAPFGQTMQDERNPWDHRALMEATPGSIFKLVVAMAGLEEGIVSPQSQYYCKGKWERYRLKDAKETGHGQQSFAEAFADSCNLYLGSLSKQLGGKKLDAYAQRLGLNQKIIWSDKKQKQLPTEHTGMIFADEELQKDAGAVVQTGIGQRDVKITPVQAANMVTAIFSQGKAWQPRIVKELRGPDNRVIKRFPRKYLPTSQAFKPSTLQMTRQMMRKTVTDGTASSLKHAKWALAGKTGTAQIGVNGDLYNKWMIGFGPFEKPRYTVSVVIRSVKNPNDPRAKEIFGQVMDAIAEIEHKRQK